MPSISATYSIAGRVHQPICSWARQSKGNTAEACLPAGYCAIVFLAHVIFSAVNAKETGCSGSRRRILIYSDLPFVEKHSFVANRPDRPH